MYDRTSFEVKSGDEVSEAGKSLVVPKIVHICCLHLLISLSNLAEKIRFKHKFLETFVRKYFLLEMGKTSLEWGNGKNFCKLYVKFLEKTKNFIKKLGKMFLRGEKTNRIPTNQKPTVELTWQAKISQLANTVFPACLHHESQTYTEISSQMGPIF